MLQFGDKYVAITKKKYIFQGIKKGTFPRFVWLISGNA